MAVRHPSDPNVPPPPPDCLVWAIVAGAVGPVCCGISATLFVLVALVVRWPFGR